jgi:hypothetical protein
MPCPRLPGAHRLAARVLFLSAIVGGAACGTGPNPSDVDAAVTASCLEAEQHSDFAWIRDNLFRTSCSAFSACHQGQRPAGSLNLTPALAHAELVGVPAAAVAGWVRVVPGAPEQSYLLVKLGAIDGPLGIGGTRMPPNSPPICGQKIDAVARWISAGAEAE